MWLEDVIASSCSALIIDSPLWADVFTMMKSILMQLQLWHARLHAMLKCMKGRNDKVLKVCMQRDHVCTAVTLLRTLQSCDLAG